MQAMKRDGLASNKKEVSFHGHSQQSKTQDARRRAGRKPCRGSCRRNPTLAFAAGTTSQSTEVTIQSVNPSPSGDNLSFSVPTQIPFVAKADGTMLSASEESLEIQNKSAFPIHVVNMAVAEQSPFKLVADVSTGTEANAFQFTINGTKAAASVDTSAEAAWDMGYEGSATGTIPLKTTDAKIARVTTDISKPQKAAAITWTVASGAAK